MTDLFEAEQKILDAAISRANELRDSDFCDKDELVSLVREYGSLVKEYGSLLKQLRRVTKFSDRISDDLNSSNISLLDKTHYDALTGMYNRLFLDESLKRIVRSLSRSGEPLSVLMVNVDFFRRYNDIYGRRKGDDCLKDIAAALCDSLFRADDIAARYGDDEFAVVLPSTGEKGACVIANRIIGNIRMKNIPHEKNDAASCVTVSIGVVTDLERRKQSGGDYIDRAVKALQMSKQSGRNKYTFLDFREV